MPSNTNICLIILMNHNYEDNIDKLRKIYGSRFSNIKFLIPHYNGKDPDCFTVYYSCFRYQGYFAQVRKDIQKPEYTHYVVVADDMMLNPDINENNLLENLSLPADTAFISAMKQVASDNFTSNVILDLVAPFVSKQSVSNIGDFIPSPKELSQLIERYPRKIEKLEWYSNFFYVDFPPLKFNLWNYLKLKISRLKFLNTLRLFYLLAKARFKKQSVPNYILLSYADFLVLPAQSFDEFCHLSGKFAIYDMLMDSAIPYALLQIYPKLYTFLDTEIQGQTFFEGSPQKPITTMQDFNQYLQSIFNPNLLYLHPIKLSNVDLDDSR